MIEHIIEELRDVREKVEQKMAEDYSNYQLIEDEMKTLDQYNLRTKFTFDDYSNILKRKGYKPAEKSWLARAQRAKKKYPQSGYASKEDVPEYQRIIQDLKNLVQRAKQSVKEDVNSGAWIHRRTKEIADQSVYFDDEYHNRYDEAREELKKQMQSPEWQETFQEIGAWDIVQRQLQGNYEPTIEEKEARRAEQIAYEEEQRRLEEVARKEQAKQEQQRLLKERQEADKRAKAEQAEKTAIQSKVTQLARKIEKATIKEGIDQYLEQMKGFEEQGYDMTQCQHAVEQFNAKVDKRRNYEMRVLSSLKGLQKELQQNEDEKADVIYASNTDKFQKELEKHIKGGKTEFRVLKEESEMIIEDIRHLLDNRVQARKEYENQVIQAGKNNTVPDDEPVEKVQPKEVPRQEEEIVAPISQAGAVQPKEVPRQEDGSVTSRPQEGVVQPKEVPRPQAGTVTPRTQAGAVQPKKIEAVQPNPTQAVQPNPTQAKVVIQDNSKMKLKAKTQEQRDDALFARMLEYMEENQKVSSQIRNQKFQQDMKKLLQGRDDRKKKLKALEDRILKRSGSDNAVKVQDLVKRKVYISKYGFCIYKGFLKKENKYVFDVISQNKNLGRVQRIGKQIQMTKGYNTKTMFQLTQKEVPKNICWRLEKDKEYPAGSGRAIYKGMGTTNSYHFELYKESGELRRVTFTFEDILRGVVSIAPDLDGKFMDNASDEISVDKLMAPVPANPEFYRLKVQGMNPGEILMTKYGTQKLIGRKVEKGQVIYVLLDLSSQQQVEITPDDVQTKKYAYHFPVWQDFININGALCYVKTVNYITCQFEVVDLTCMKIRTLGYAQMKKYPMEPATKAQVDRIQKKITLDLEFEESMALHFQGAQLYSLDVLNGKSK